ncbi:MAG TPA: hypothetical protein VNT60_06665 [Deinococcales bacterium]|nr:hypothetical protein [Deinococcales bacterium]
MSGTTTELNALLALVDRAARRLQQSSPAGATLAGAFRAQASSLRAAPADRETIEQAERLLDRITASLGGERLKALPRFGDLAMDAAL